MATTNPTVTDQWGLIVLAGYEFLLSGRLAGLIEIAISDTETAPTVFGHLFNPRKNEAIERPRLGPGYVYARRIDGSTDPLKLALTAWTP